MSPNNSLGPKWTGKSLLNGTGQLICCVQTITLKWKLAEFQMTVVLYLQHQRFCEHDCQCGGVQTTIHLYINNNGVTAHGHFHFKCHWYWAFFLLQHNCCNQMWHMVLLLGGELISHSKFAYHHSHQAVFIRGCVYCNESSKHTVPLKYFVQKFVIIIVELYMFTVQCVGQSYAAYILSAINA